MEPPGLALRESLKINAAVVDPEKAQIALDLKRALAGELEPAYPEPEPEVKTRPDTPVKKSPAKPVRNKNTDGEL
jgi:hypothetical protein